MKAEMLIEILQRFCTNNKEWKKATVRVGNYNGEPQIALHDKWGNKHLINLLED